MSEQQIAGCFYCSGPRGRNPECAEHGDRAQLEAENKALRSALEDLHAMVSRRGSCVGVKALLACTADGIVSMRDNHDAVEEEREACAKIAEAQPYYPDTITGKRQQWVKDRIALTIRARR